MWTRKLTTILISSLLVLSMCIPTFAETPDLQTLKAALNEAQTTYENATNTKEEARIAFEEQSSKTDSALDEVRNLTGDELTAAIEESESVAEEAKNNYASAVTAYNESLATLNGGAFSFFKWVAANYPGYADDANNAIAVLEKAQSLGYVTDAEYSQDQTSFYSMKIAERYMEDYVTLRAYLGIEYVPATNLTAVADSMMSVGGADATYNHYSAWLTARGWDENLSFGYGVYGDYKNIYNGELVEILGYTPDETVGDDTTDLAETNEEAELADGVSVVAEAEIPSETESYSEAEETSTIEETISETSETVEETVIQETEVIEETRASEEPEVSESTTSVEVEVSEETSPVSVDEESTENSTSENLGEENIEENTEENSLSLASSNETESESSEEITYPTFDEWYAQEIANGMLNTCPFLAIDTPRSPFSGWYTYEKYNYDLRTTYNYDNGDQVGHYYNLTRKRNSEIFAMSKKGYTYVLDMKTYYTTSGTPSKGLSTGINLCTNYAAMSVSEYNSLLDAFYNSLNLKSQKDTLEGYKTTYQNAVTKIAFCKAKKTYEEASTAYETAKAALETARNNVISYVPYSPEVTLSNVNSGIQISWEAVDTAKMYYVYRKTDSTDWSMIGIRTTTTYIDRKATDGETYYYTVLTANRRKNKSDYLFANQKIMRLENAYFSRSYSFSYKYDTYTDPYEVCTIQPIGTYDGDILFFRAEDDGSLTQIDFVNSDIFGMYIELSKDNTPLNKSYTYYYKVVKDEYESALNSMDITITDAVGTVNQTKIGSNRIRLTWNAVKTTDNQAITYKVYRRYLYSDGSISNWTLQASTKQTSYMYTVRSTKYTVQFLVIPLTNKNVVPSIGYYR